MIEMEPMNTTVSDEALRLVALFCGHEVKDRLLYEVPDGPLNRTLRTPTRIGERRPIVGHWRSARTRTLEDRRGEA